MIHDHRRYHLQRSAFHCHATNYLLHDPSCAYAKYWHSSDVMPEALGHYVTTVPVFDINYGTRGHVITNTKSLQS